jgi:hypothetical protein
LLVAIKKSGGRNDSAGVPCDTSVVAIRKIPYNRFQKRQGRRSGYCSVC